jgi:hypothetical protein
MKDMERQTDEISITAAYRYHLLTKVDPVIKTWSILLLPSDPTTAFQVNDVTIHTALQTYYT